MPKTARKPTPVEEAQARLLPAGKPRPTRLADVPLAQLPPDEALPGARPEASLIASVEALGVLQPVVLVRDPEAKRGDAVRYRVVAGNRRVKAARRAGHDSVPAHVYEDLRDATTALMVLAENHARHSNPTASYEALVALEPLVAQMSDVGLVTGIPKHTMERLLRLGALAPRLRAVLRAGGMAASVAEEASKLPAALQERLADMAEGNKGKLTAHDVTGVRRERTRAAAEAQLAGLLGTTLPPLAADDAPRRVCGCSHLPGCSAAEGAS